MARVIPFGTGDRPARHHDAPAHEEEVGGVRLGDEAVAVEHQRIIGTGCVRLDLGQG
ncbi:hypothetical protein [Candidatus Palauibacter sp.]|uniref:hypothetical protein n=1 Tax=Candidatus Palauibacter sp. TaxID=3101350 RepID=UPI003C70065E